MFLMTEDRAETHRSSLDQQSGLDPDPVFRRRRAPPPCTGMACCVPVTTFAELGVSVPLFLGDVKFVEGIEEARKCVLCGQTGPCLPLDDVLVSCPGCGGQTRVGPKKRATDRKDPCHRCHTQVDLASVLIADAADAVRLGLPTQLRG